LVVDKGKKYVDMLEATLEYLEKKNKVEESKEE